MIIPPPTGRPILTHLNADTTWNLQIPATKTSKPFNILIDPWFKGPQSDVAKWFSTQEHAVESAISCCDYLRSGIVAQLDDPKAVIDAVAISHEFTDHCHKATLTELKATVPIFAPEPAAGLIRSWKHFDKVITIPDVSKDKPWEEIPGDSLPDHIRIARVTTPNNPQYYHSALVIAFDGEAVIYSPHGVNPADLDKLDNTGLKTLALLHGMHDVRLFPVKQLNLGGLNAMRAVKACKAKYWITTHDEVKEAHGLIAPFLRRKKWTVDEALAKMDDVHDHEFVEVDVGHSLVLD